VIEIWNFSLDVLCEGDAGIDGSLAPFKMSEPVQSEIISID